MIDLESAFTYYRRPELDDFGRYLRPRMRQLYRIAEAVRPECPLGATVYVASRLQNESVPNPAEKMKRAKLATLLRWERHWLRGGSLKVISRSREEQRALRRERRIAAAEWAKKNPSTWTKYDPEWWEAEQGKPILERMIREQEMREKFGC